MGIAHQGLNPGRTHEIAGQCPSYGKATWWTNHWVLIVLKMMFSSDLGQSGRKSSADETDARRSKRPDST